eukprot:1839436-Pyramimonas_sp.AAC.1
MHLCMTSHPADFPTARLSTPPHAIGRRPPFRFRKATSRAPRLARVASALRQPCKKRTVTLATASSAALSARRVRQCSNLPPFGPAPDRRGLLARLVFTAAARSSMVSWSGRFGAAPGSASAPAGGNKLWSPSWTPAPVASVAGLLVRTMALLIRCSPTSFSTAF